MMEKDKTLEELFKNFNPELNDDDAFMNNLSKRLEAVEYLKELQDRKIRHYKYMVLMVFILGILCGGFSIYYLLRNPDIVSSIAFESNIPLLQFLSENIHAILLSAIAIMICFVVISFANMLQDVWEMKQHERSVLDKKNA